MTRCLLQDKTLAQDSLRYDPSLISLPGPATKIENVPRVLVIGGESSRVCRLGDLAVQDFLEGIHPLAFFVQSVLLFGQIVLFSFLVVVFFAQWVLCSSQSIHVP